MGALFTLTTTEAAARLGVSRYRVWQFIKEGRLPALKIGRDWLIDELEVDRLERRPRGRPPRQADKTWHGSAGQG